MAENSQTTKEDKSKPQGHAGMRAPDKAWVNLTQEEVLDPAQPIIDPHHHLWDFGTWRYLFDEISEDLRAGHNVLSTVHVQVYAMHRADGPSAMRSVGETDFINGIAAMSASGAYGPARVAAGIVGYADLCLGAQAREVLEAHIAVAGDRFKGVRYITAANSEITVTDPVYLCVPGMLQNTKFLEGFAVLGAMGLSFDAWLLHPQIEELIVVAKAFPETKIVLNHIGGPLAVGKYANQREEVFADWRSSIKRLAECPNVSVKLGGFRLAPMGFGFDKRDKPVGSEELASTVKPYVEVCIEEFGR